MGTCLSKKKVSSSSSSSAPLAVSSKKPAVETDKKNPENVAVTVQSKPREEKTDSELKQRKKIVNNKVKEKHEPAQEEGVEDKGQLKKEIVIMKHRKSYDAPKSEASGSSSMVDDKVIAAATTMGVRTSNCNEEEVDAILLHCGRLSRNSSGKAASSSAGRRYSGSKRSFDFDHCENGTISNDEEQKKVNANGNSGLCEDDNDMANGEKSSRQHRQRHRRSPRPSPEGRRRRTPSRERDQQQQNCSGSSKERRVSRSPGRRTSETTAPSSNASNNNNNNTSSRPGKMVSVPASVTSSLVMDKSNNVGGSGGGESAAAAAAVKRIVVKRNVGAASPRSQSPARRNVGAASPRSQSPSRTNGNTANAKVLLSENQQQPAAISRNNSRRAEHSPYRRNPLSELDPNSLAYPQSASNNSSCMVQNKTRKENDTEANQKQNSTSKVAFDRNVSANCKTKVQQEEDVKVQSSMADNVVVKTVVAARVDNLKSQQALTRSRSSRRSCDLDLDPEVLLAPPQSYTSLLLEDIQNFHQMNTPSVTLPACVTKACSILEAVADLNSATAEDRRTPPSYQSSRNECNVPLSTNQYGKRVTDTKDPFVESEVVVNDDVMEPSFHKYVTVRTRGGSVCGVDMEDQESSGSNSFTGSSGQQPWGISSASWEPSSADSRDCLTSKLNCSRGASDGDGTRKILNSKSRDCDHQHSGGIGRSRIGAIKGLHNIPAVVIPADGSCIHIDLIDEFTLFLLYL